MSAPRKYTALHPVEHDGERTERGGTITLPPEDAEPLVRVGALAEGNVEVEHVAPTATVDGAGAKPAKPANPAKKKGAGA